MKRKKRKPMPKWIWQLPHSVLNYKLKHLLAYFWWCADRGCRDWNYAIAKRFKVSDRTIRRWIHSLQTKHLIYINFPGFRSRTIYRRPYYERAVWWLKSGQIKALPKKSQETSQPNSGRPKVAAIYNAQRKNKERRFILTPFSYKEAVEKPAGVDFRPSNAGGLGGSRVHRMDFKTPKEYFAAKLEELRGLSESNGATGSTAPHDKVDEM